MLYIWNVRLDVIPAQAGIQPRGIPWIPAYAGMTIPACVRYVCTLECITRSRWIGAVLYEPGSTNASNLISGNAKPIPAGRAVSYGFLTKTLQST